MDARDRSNIRYGVFLSYVSMILSILGTLFITNRVLDYIGDYNYGLFSFVTSITAWLPIASSALNASFLRFVSMEAAERCGRVSRIVTIYQKLFTIIGIGIAIAGLFVLGIGYFNSINIASYSWPDSKLLYALFAISLINICITIAFTAFSLFINYKKEFIFEKTVSIIVTILNYIGYLIISYYTRSIVLIAAYGILVSIVGIILNVTYAIRILGIKFEKVRLRDNQSLLKSVSVFSSVLIVNSVVDQINSNVDKTLLGLFSVPENITLYQLGMQFSLYLGVMAVAISGVFAPSINELVVSGRKGEVDSLFLRVSRVQGIIVCCIAFGFLSCGKDFVVLWIGESRLGAYYSGAILMLLNIMPLSVKTSIDIQRAMNKHYFRSAVFIAVAVINVLVSILLLQVFTVERAIYACLLGTTIATVSTQWIIMNIYNYKVIGLPIPPLLKRLMLYISYGVVCTFAVIFVREVLIANCPSVLARLLIEMTVFTCSYLILIMITEGEFIRTFLRRANRA